ncbi:MAG: hypothetical protein RL071_168, partial [Pseudomonadota bacterium]
MSVAEPRPAAPLRPSLQADVRPTLSWTAAAHGLPLLSELVLHNPGEAPLPALTLELWTEPPVLPGQSIPLPALEAGAQRALPPIPCGATLGALAALDGPTAARLRARIPAPDGEAALWEASWTLQALPPAHWAGAGAPPELLLAFVQPQLPLLDGLGAPASPGPLTAAGQRQRLSAALAHLAGLRTAAGAPLRLDPAPPRWWDEGQPVRPLPDLRAAGAWSPLERAVQAAAALERAGVDAQLVLFADGPRLGCWLEARPQPAPLQDDPAALRTRADQGELLILDLDAIFGGLSLDQAGARGRDALQP